MNLYNIIQTCFGYFYFLNMGLILFSHKGLQNFGTALQKTKVFNNEMAGSLCQPKFDQRQDKSNRLIKKKKITNTSSGCIEKKQYK